MDELVGEVYPDRHHRGLAETAGPDLTEVDAGTPLSEVSARFGVALNDQTLRTRLARIARARAAKFSWDKTAAGVAAVIKELVGE